MSAIPTDPPAGISIPGDGVLHDGYIVKSAYRGRLVGVESEYFIVDRETLELRDCLPVLEKHSQFGARLKPEAVREQIEISTNAFLSIVELEKQLREDLREVVELLDGAGAMLLPIALLDGRTHTWSSSRKLELLQRHLGEPFRSSAGSITADQINLGADDEADAFRTFRKILTILPEIVGLSAASPFRNEVPNGIACNRMDAYDEALSAVSGMGGMPPLLESLTHYAHFIGRQPIFKHPDTCYAYVRPMPHRGVAAEIRCIDKQISLCDTLGFAALGKAVMLSTDEQPMVAASEAAMSASRRDGVVDRARASALINYLERFLPEDEIHYLDCLRAKLEAGSTASSLLAHQARIGYRPLLRLLAEEARAEIRDHFEPQAKTSPRIRIARRTR